MECYICRQRGHIAIKCPNATQDIAQTSTQTTTNETRNNESTIQNLTQMSVDLTEQLKSKPTSNSINRNLNDTPNKRPLSESVTSQETTSFSPDNMEDIEGPANEADKTSMPPPTDQKEIKNETRRTTHPPKKRKKTSKSQNSTTEKIIDHKNIEDIIKDKQTTYPLTGTDFIAFLESAFGKSDVITEARRYTEDISGLTEMLYDIYPHLNERALKNRFSRLIKKLKGQSETENSEDNESVCSSHSEAPDEQFLGFSS
ncbi:hypothetical protein HHI36_001665 [Cryptolaemus montrouzieri]|uniref:CCHC-type domain-containing protein n=1 Tax=Cryptolaemus montrouzieri TaxID=559131 RepID=A0ABD2P8B6_9CUCU